MSRVNRRRVLWTMSIVLAVVAGLVLVNVTAHAQATFTGPWSITMVSESGDYIGGGTERFFDDANAELQVAEGGWAIYLQTSGGTYGESFSLTFQAGSGRVLGPGWYPDAQRAGFQASGRPGMDISGEGRGCNQIAGNFEVRDIAWSPTGTLQRLWLIYEQHCEGGNRALFGEIRIGTTVGPADVEPDTVRWPEIHPGAQGEAVPVRVRQIGASAVGVSGVTLGGAHPQDFSIRSDGCTGRILSEGDACLVYVRFAPKSPGPRTAVLRLATDAATFQVRLDGYGVPGITDWQMTSDPGDYIGQGTTYLYTSAVDTIGYSGSAQYASGGVDAANGDWWGASFVPAQGDVLVAGATYPDAHRYPFNGSGPGMDVSGSGRGCNTLVGSFTVNQIGFSSANGALDRLDLTFEQHCEGATPALRGRLRYRARADVTPPAQATGVTATRASDGSVHLSWANPSDGDYAGTVVRFLPSPQAPGLATAGRYAYTGTGTSVDVSGLSAGRTYTFAVFTYDSTGNVSRARVVSVPGSPRQKITVAPTTITYGSSASVTGVLTDIDGVPLAGRTTRLQSRPPGTATWTTVATLTTSSTGTLSTSVKPSANLEYRLISDATSAYAAAPSAAVLVQVRQQVTAALSASSITLGHSVTIKGSVAPNHAGQSVSLQYYYSGAWHTVKTATLTSTSTYSFSYWPGSAGIRSLRVYRPADADHAAGTSPTMKLTINS
jgi:Fibronectin type III domain